MFEEKEILFILYLETMLLHDMTNILNIFVDKLQVLELD